jgi:uncharacterized protein YjdB
MNSTGRIADQLRRPRSAACVAALAIVITACTESLLVEPAAAPTQLLVSYAVSPSTAGSEPSTAGSDGPGRSFDRADALRVQLSRSTGAALDTILPFASAGAVTHVPLRLDVRDEQERMGVTIELRRGTDVLFRGSADVVVTRGDTTRAELQLIPVPAATLLPAAIPPITALGDTVRIAGAVVFATGDTIPDVALSWTSSAPTVATVTQTGLVTAVSEGQTEIRASHGAFTASVPLQVAALVTRVIVQPATQNIMVGQTRSVTATAQDRRGNSLARTFTFASSNASVASVVASGAQTASVRGVAPGSASVTATTQGVIGHASVTIVMQPVASVSVVPGSATVYVGQTAQLTATPRDAAGQPLNRPVTWSSSNSSIVSVNQSGLINAVSTGSAIISATSEGVSGTATITVSGIFFEDDFESGMQWSTTGLWNRTTGVNIRNTLYPLHVDLAYDDDSAGMLPHAPQGSWYAWFGRPTTGNYIGQQLVDDSEGSGGTSQAPVQGSLTSPAFTIPANMSGIFLNFTTWFEIESINPDSRDLMEISFIDATGAPLIVILLNPAEADESYNAHPFTSGGYWQPPVFTKHTVSVEELSGRTVRLRFTFNTVDTQRNGFRGWIVDDVSVTHRPPPPVGQSTGTSAGLSLLTRRICATGCTPQPAARQP